MEMCRGWKEKLVIDFAEFTEEVTAKLKEIWTCRIDGCRYGMKGESGNFIRKSWKVITTAGHHGSGVLQPILTQMLSWQSPA